MHCHPNSRRRCRKRLAPRPRGAGKGPRAAGTARTTSRCTGKRPTGESGARSRIHPWRRIAIAPASGPPAKGLSVPGARAHCFLARPAPRLRHGPLERKPCTVEATPAHSSATPHLFSPEPATASGDAAVIALPVVALDLVHSLRGFQELPIPILVTVPCHRCLAMCSGQSHCAADPQTRHLPIPTKLSTHSERSRPAVPGQVVHRFRGKSSGLSGDP